MSNKHIAQLIVGPIETNCWIYPLGEKDAAIIDPGDEAEKIISFLKEHDFRPAYILLTHGHFDHITAAPAIVRAFNSIDIVIAVHRLDSVYLGLDAQETHLKSIKSFTDDISFIDTIWPAEKRDIPQAGLFLEEGDNVGPFTVLHLPGHTRGSAAFWDKSEGVIFTGDTLFEGSYGRTDLPGGNEQDISTSLHRLFGMDGNIKVLPGHGNTTTIGREASRGMIC